MIALSSYLAAQADVDEWNRAEVVALPLFSNGWIPVILLSDEELNMFVICE